MCIISLCWLLYQTTWTCVWIHHQLHYDCSWLPVPLNRHGTKPAYKVRSVTPYKLFLDSIFNQCGTCVFLNIPIHASIIGLSVWNKWRVTRLIGSNIILESVFYQPTWACVWIHHRLHYDWSWLLVPLNHHSIKPAYKVRGVTLYKLFLDFIFNQCWTCIFSIYPFTPTLLGLVHVVNDG